MSFRILSLDGGGTWALIQVKALMALYPAGTRGHTVLADFDLVGANSWRVASCSGGCSKILRWLGCFHFLRINPNVSPSFPPRIRSGTGSLHDVTGSRP